MSVRTAAEEELEKAVECVRQAQEHLGQALHKATWGSDELSREYREDMSAAKHELYLIEQRIDEGPQ
jgi:hypothetical protein